MFLLLFIQIGISIVNTRNEGAGQDLIKSQARKKPSGSWRFCVVRSPHPLCLSGHLLIFIPRTANAAGGKLSETLFSNHWSKADTGSKFYNDSDLFVFNVFWVKLCCSWLKKLPSNWHSSDNNCWCWLLVWAGWTIVENELFVVRKNCYRLQVSDLILAPILSYISSSENFYWILRATKCCDGCPVEVWCDRSWLTTF